MKKLLIAGLLTLQCASTFAMPVPIPAARLSDYIMGIMIAIKEHFQHYGGCTYKDNIRFKKSDMVDSDGDFEYNSIYFNVTKGTVDDEQVNPIVTLEAQTALDTSRIQKLVLSVETKPDLKSVTSYKFVEYLTQDMLVNTGTIADPKIEKRIVTTPTGAVCASRLSE